MTHAGGCCLMAGISRCTEAYLQPEKHAKTSSWRPTAGDTCALQEGTTSSRLKLTHGDWCTASAVWHVCAGPLSCTIHLASEGSSRCH